MDVALRQVEREDGARAVVGSGVGDVAAVGARSCGRGARRCPCPWPCCRAGRSGGRAGQIGRDARAPVSDLHTAGSGLEPDVDGDRFRSGRELVGVGDQVAQDLADAVHVGVDRDLGLRDELDDARSQRRLLAGRLDVGAGRRPPLLAEVFGSDRFAPQEPLDGVTSEGTEGDELLVGLEAEAEPTTSSVFRLSTMTRSCQCEGRRGVCRRPLGVSIPVPGNRTGKLRC